MNPISPIAGSSMILSQEAVIGITIVGSVVGTVALVLAIIGCFYCIRRCTKKEDEINPQLHPNEAYSRVLQLRRNEAYETTGKPPVSQEDTDTQLYDEMTLSGQQTKEPVYAEIGN